MKVRAVKDWEYKSVRQFLSGYHLGFERKPVWRFEIDMATQPIRSTKIYADETKALKAGKRFVEKLLS